MSFTLDNKKIQQWLEFRDWLFYYGTTRPNSGMFYPIDKQYVAECLKDDYYGFPHFSNSREVDVEQIELSLAHDNCFTTAFPSVVFRIWGHNKEYQDDNYEIEIYFCFQRGDTEYQKVFHGFVKNLNQLLFILQSLGIDEKYLA